MGPSPRWFGDNSLHVRRVQNEVSTGWCLGRTKLGYSSFIGTLPDAFCRVPAFKAQAPRGLVDENSRPAPCLDRAAAMAPRNIPPHLRESCRRRCCRFQIGN